MASIYLKMTINHPHHRLEAPWFWMSLGGTIPSILGRTTVPPSFQFHLISTRNSLLNLLRPHSLFPCSTIVMEISDAYAIAVGGGFVLLFLVNSLPYVTGLAEYLTTQMSKHLTYPYLLSRHRFLGPWTRAGFGLQLIYIITNIVCLSVETISPSLRIASLSDVGLRAGTLSIINMIPLFAGSHLSYLADLLGLTLRGFRCIHRSAGLMSFSLAILHVLVEFASRPSFDMNLAENLFAVIVSTEFNEPQFY